MIPLVDLKAQDAAVGAEVRAAVADVLASQHFIGGPELASFEAEFAAFLGAAEVVGVASGTAAVHLALRACGVGPGDEVITVAHTFAATAEAVCHAGAQPVFVDVDEQTGNIDPAAAAAAITERTRALVPVHLYGRPAPMEDLRELARSRGLKLVEDAAQAHGARVGERSVGTLADLSCFSFYPGKNLGACGDAGGVSGNDQALLARVRLLQNHGRRSKYEHEIVGWGERLDALQAAVLRVKLRHLEGWIDARRRVAVRYQEQLRDVPGLDLTLTQEGPGERHAYHLFVVRCRDRDAVLAGLRERGIGVGVHYPVPLHRQAAFRDLVPARLSLPHTEALAANVLSLPVYPELSEAQQDLVCNALRELCR